MRPATRAATAALLTLVLPACGSTPYSGSAGPSTPSMEPAPPENAPPPVAELNRLEAACRQEIPAETFLRSAETLSEVRAAIGSLCAIELVGDTPLQWRVSCGSDDFFASGSHEFGATTACTGGSNAFECLGHGLRSMTAHTSHVDVAVVGHVDLELPVNTRLDCESLRSGGWADAPWTRVEATRERANDRLAWCRAARAATSVRTGLGSTPRGVRIAAVGASSAWLGTKLEGRAGSCPQNPLESTNPLPPGDAVPDAGSAEANEDTREGAADERGDDVSRGRCQAARRVDLLVRIEATPSPQQTACSRSNQDPEGALFCLEECVARPERRSVGLAQPPSFFDGTSSTVPRGWFVSRSPGAGNPDVLRGILPRLGLGDLAH